VARLKIRPRLVASAPHLDGWGGVCFVGGGVGWGLGFWGVFWVFFVLDLGLLGGEGGV